MYSAMVTHFALPVSGRQAVFLGDLLRRWWALHGSNVRLTRVKGVLSR